MKASKPKASARVRVWREPITLPTYLPEDPGNGGAPGPQASAPEDELEEEVEGEGADAGGTTASAL